MFKEDVKRRLHFFFPSEAVGIRERREHVEEKVIGEYDLDFVLENREKIYLSDIDRVVRVHEGFKSTDGGMVYIINEIEAIEDEETALSYMKAIADRDLYRERQKHRGAEKEIERREEAIEEAIEQLEAERRKQEWEQKREEEIEKNKVKWYQFWR